MFCAAVSERPSHYNADPMWARTTGLRTRRGATRLGEASGSRCCTPACCVGVQSGAPLWTLARVGLFWRDALRRTTGGSPTRHDGNMRNGARHGPATESPPDGNCVELTFALLQGVGGSSDPLTIDATHGGPPLPELARGMASGRHTFCTLWLGQGHGKTEGRSSAGAAPL